MPDRSSRPRRRMADASVIAVVLSSSALVACGGDDGLPRLAAAQPGTLAGDCDALAQKLQSLSDLGVTATTTVAAGGLQVGGQDVPAHCRVTGSIERRTSAVDGQAYAIGYEMRLPRAWSGRFLYQGNGGLDGAVLTAAGGFGGGPVTNALLQGFAVISSDAGHSAAQNPGFGVDPQARLNYGYQAAAKLTPVAKQIVQAAYGRGPDRSYFGGCSNGGRHTMVAASRLADEYDGFLAGAPGFNLPLAAVANIYKGQRYAMIATNPSADLSTAITPAERRVVADAVLARCDALDGLADGLVQDVAACRAAFDWQRDVPTCAGARDGSCLSAAQKTALAPVFSGAVDGAGRSFYASFPVDAGYAGAGIPPWAFVAPVQRDSVAVGFVFKTPPATLAGFDGTAFTLNANIDTLLAQIAATDATYTESSLSFMRPPNPTDYRQAWRRGAKMLVYHGVSDPIFSVNDTTAWFDALDRAHGGDAHQFARVFPVPGMGHCSGGPATDQFDPLGALVAWVEQGEAPERLVARARGAGNAGGVNADVPATWAADRTRPLCAYPKVARYLGSGSTEDAASFRCE